MKLAEMLEGSPYQGYAYAYPHKTAYRPIAPALPLRKVWADERRDALFLYVHVPFCGMRCGFCNLFTQAKPADALVELYLDALEQEALRVREAIPDATFARLALGGGTPTYLDTDQLERVLDIAFDVMEVAPSAVEVSPETVTTEKVALLRERGTRRVSMGIQSFIERETAESGRPQKLADVEAALDMLAGFPIRNVDLIYGLPGQTVETWLFSLRRALEWHPEELYLYPLYVRPLTGLGRSRKEWDDERLACYRAGRDHLIESGYEQVSMRMFRRAVKSEGSVYCCQDDGMVGIGCGARSYTRGVHYSGEYAVSAKGVRDVLADYVSRDPAAFAEARYGFVLNRDEQRRRFLLQSLLNLEGGLDFAHFRRRFGELPDLGELVEHGLAVADESRMLLTPSGIERSDVVGPWLYSDAVQRLSTEYVLR